ncbi:Inorganic phosphate transporter pho84 [Saitozyma podzolica]|uniref:Inorganic phosphate transporter pho84 n=1 Tax=Saitozyma podzolica TaxID=1890683 RepID=A0A427YXJ1_9TREE|nr:Inorganic phosphate transporter pho84 [Saitozyma podzolica]
MEFELDPLVGTTDQEQAPSETPSPVKKAGRSQKPPRPPNAWILYRSDKLRAIAASQPVPGLDAIIAETTVSSSRGRANSGEDSLNLAKGKGGSKEETPASSAGSEGQEGSKGSMLPPPPPTKINKPSNIKQASQDVDTYLTTGTYVVDHIHNNERAEVPRATLSDFAAYISQWKNFKILFGASWSWFALDVAFYGLGLNSSTILSTIGFGSYSQGSKQLQMYQTLCNVAVGNIILAIGGLIPGYYFSFALVDFWGRKPIQLMGFILLTIIFCCMGFGYHAMLATNSGKKAFWFLYCIANFFQNFGPNTTTFIIPGEVFPTRYRSTGHDISAASGKLGAIIAQVGSPVFRTSAAPTPGSTTSSSSSPSVASWGVSGRC